MVSILIPLIIAFLMPFIVYPTITSFPVLYGVILITSSRHIQPPLHRKDNDCQEFLLRQIYSQSLCILYKSGVS